MTEEDFYKELSNLNHQWVVHESGFIRTIHNDYKLCPLTAVQYAKSGNYIPPAFPMTAAYILGLDPDFAASLVINADNHINIPDEQKIVRTKLLEACKLNEAA